MRAGLSPQCLCGNNQVNFTSLIIMFAVFLFPILRTWLQNEAVPFLYKRLSCSFSLPNSSQLPEYFNARTLFLVVKGNSLICSDQHCVQHFYKVYFFIPILFPRLPLFFYFNLIFFSSILLYYISFILHFYTWLFYKTE